MSYHGLLYIDTDASHLGCGAVLMQKYDKEKLQPIHFASFRFNPREQRQRSFHELS